MLILDEVKVSSDAWVVIHPEAPGGGPDASQSLGRSFVMHGVTERVPVHLDGTAPASGATVYAMLHDDTGEIGRFEFGGAGTTDQPLAPGGTPVVQAIVVQ